MYKVKTLYGRTKVIFSSPLQIENNCQIRLLIMVELDEKKHPEIRNKLNIIRVITLAEQCNQTSPLTTTSDFTVKKAYGIIFKLLPAKIFYVPLYAAYNCKIYATPDNDNYVPALIFDIRGYNILKVDELKVITCKQIKPTESTSDRTSLVLGNNDFELIKRSPLNVKKHRQIMPQMSANRRVCLYAPIKIYNSLPFSVRIDIDDVSPCNMIEPGEVLNIHLSIKKLNTCRIHISYLNVNWQGVLNWSKFVNNRGELVPKIEPEKINMVLSPTTELSVADKHLTVYLSFAMPNAFTFYSPYWLVNKSGQPIKIRVSLCIFKQNFLKL